MGFPYHLLTLVAIALLSMLLFRFLAHRAIRKWAEANEYQILRMHYRFWYRGPFVESYSRWNYSWVYYATVVERGAEQSRDCWVCCHYLSGQVISQWADEADLKRTNDRLVLAGVAIVVASLITFTCAWLQVGHVPLTASGHEEVGARARTFAAIAYSPATGRHGIAEDCLSREGAEESARRLCGSADSRIVCWVHNGYCALAIGADGHWASGWSDGAHATLAAAREHALARCREKSAEARVLAEACSFARK